MHRFQVFRDCGIVHDLRKSIDNRCSRTFLLFLSFDIIISSLFERCHQVLPVVVDWLAFQPVWADFHVVYGAVLKPSCACCRIGMVLAVLALMLPEFPHF
jgi:hypothetical protein